ncbi:hypothetical protein VP01_1738g3 [Puccinia sorghi]|uniref:Uncharacterized protein n=1 Tax=Puccinia sorghi TaxID=27349 RepID=A0A0L6VF97_9BASI|nr:hypothetical protein VP01_1738g3 [Puccinia sorghi]
MPFFITVFIILFVLWLHLFCNVSQEKCKAAIQIIINILSASAKNPITICSLDTIPHDPQTMIGRANLDVYKQFSNSDPCYKELFFKKKIYQGEKDIGDLENYTQPPHIPPTLITTPCCVFISQSILTWVKWLLSRPETEKEINDWIQVNHELKNQGYYADIQHGNNLTKTTWTNRPNLFNLRVSLFVDWFNPCGNKISCKLESTGFLAFLCLNLPPSLWNKLSHMCIAGITPGP